VPNTLLIRGGHLIDPAQSIDAPHDLLLADGRVAQVAAPGKIKSADKTIDATGLIVAPGLIDLHVHLREPGQSHKETIKSGTLAAAAGGFTSVCCMPNTQPVNDSPAITRWIQDPERGAVINVFPVAAATLGSLGEKLSYYPDLLAAGAVAVSDDGRPILDGAVMAEALRCAARVNMPVIQHAEDTRLSGGAPMHQGAMSFKLGLRGQPPEAEWQLVERDINLAYMENARVHVAHISTAMGIEMVRRGKRNGVQVTAEACPHHFLFTDANVADYETKYKMNPPLRTADDRDALLRAIEDGTIDAIATDHAPHALFEKEVEFDKAAFGITGLEVALALVITHLHRGRKLSLTRVIELMSTNPARIVNLEGRGTLAANSFADVTIFDPRKRWAYDVSKTRSRSRNTPYDGMTLFGKPIYTIVSGNIAFE
jgi:dihydroorotase